jgi:mono/diheme cytochrome c family protein
MRMHVFLAAAAAAALATLEIAAAGQAAATGQAAAEGDIASGKQLFEKKNCYYCHGTAGQGGRDGARIAATAMSVPAFIRYVRQPAGAMPAFTEKILSDKELMDIYAHVKALPTARAPNEIPLLDQLREKEK